VAPRKEAVSGGEATEENWFQRHLNWAWVLPQGVVFLVFIIAFCIWYFYINSPSVPSEDSIYASFLVVSVVVGGLQSLAVYGVGAWVLKMKNRSLAWLLVLFLGGFGWIIFLCLENRSELPPVPASNPTRPSLGIQGLKSQSENEKYWW
jgi:hypothetical protein